MEFLRLNTAGPLNALEAARTWRVGRSAVASSISVHAGRSETVWHEGLPPHDDAAPHPRVQEGGRDAHQDRARRQRRAPGAAPDRHDLGTARSRGLAIHPVPALINAVAKGQEPPTLYADEGGDRCYAPDAGRAIALLMISETLRHQVYNVSSGRPATNHDVAEALRAAVPGSRVELLPGRADGSTGEQPYLDISRLADDTGFGPASDLTAAVADDVTWQACHDR